MVPEVPRKELLKARLGDRSAFQAVLEVLARYTYNLAYRMTHAASDAEDLTQEIFLRLYQNLRKYDPEKPFGPWYRTVATNTALNWKRKRKGDPVPLETIEVSSSAAEPDELSVPLRQAIQDLPNNYRMVITLHYLEDLGVEEIAAAMEKPIGTIKTWLFRARDSLKEKLKSRVP